MCRTSRRAPRTSPEHHRGQPRRHRNRLGLVGGAALGEDPVGRKRPPAPGARSVHGHHSGRLSLGSTDDFCDGTGRSAGALSDLWRIFWPGGEAWLRRASQTNFLPASDLSDRRSSTGQSDAHAAAGVVNTDIPARLDRLSWSRFHSLVVVALGVTWILDGLEVTLAGSVSGALKQSPVLHLTNVDVGLANSAYLAGAVLGAVGFGWLTDRFGRTKLFFTTLAIYLLATAATAFSWSAASYALFRFLTGAGIGGEYTAINSTIQEFIPARYRGWTDLAINGSFWVGAALGAAADHRAAGSRAARSGHRLAAVFLHRRRARPRRLHHALLDSGEPALARDPWRCQSMPPLSSTTSSAVPAQPLAAGEQRRPDADHVAPAPRHAARRVRAYHCCIPTAHARCLVSASWPRRHSSIMRSSSPMPWC